MNRRTRSIVLILVLALAAGAAQALQPARPAAPEPASLFHRVWAWIAARATPESPAREKAGSIMDPDGLNGAAGPGSGGEAGGIMDPDG
jgi:hypothetical protein